MTHICLCCHQQFTGQHNAKYCQARDCQRERKNVNKRRWLAKPGKLEIKRQCQLNWFRSHPNYHKQAAARRLLDAYQGRAWTAVPPPDEQDARGGNERGR